jgi:PRTRC genetic system protein A
MFKIYINDGKQPPPTDDVYYIVCKEGVYLKKKIGIMESVTPVTNISILNSMEKVAKIHIPPIPKENTITIINFLKEVYEQFSSEGMVLLFYDQDKKEHIPYIPKQEVSGASVDYDKAILMEGCQMIGTIHSHANFSAFHSGVDDADEAHFDGLHITIGNVKDENPSISASIVSNGTRFKVDPLEYMLGIKKIQEVDETVEVPIHGTRYYTWVDGALVEQKPKTQTVKHYDKRFAIEATPEEIESLKNPAWIKNVSKKVYSYPHITREFNSPYQRGRGFSISRGSHGFNFNPVPYQYNWDGWSHHEYSGYGHDAYSDWFGAEVSAEIPSRKLKVGPVITSTERGQENDKNKFEINPCKECCYLDKKLEYIVELLEAQWPEIFEEFEDIYEQNEGSRMNGNGDTIETFCCESCNTLIETDGIDKLICPNCQNDLYMVEVDDSDIPKYLSKGAKIIKYPGFVYNLEGDRIETTDKKEDVVEEAIKDVKAEAYNSEEELIAMASNDSGDIKPESSNIFFKYITEQVKKYKLKKKNDPFPSQYKNRLTDHIAKPAQLALTGNVTPLKKNPPTNTKITYVKRTKK